MSEERSKRAGVTDAEIEAIIAQGEAGINDLVAAYEPLESTYVQSVEAAGPVQEDMPIVSSTGTLEER